MIKGLLLRSIESKEKVTIYYIDSNNTVTQRTIRVISLDDTSILAFCYWRKKIRSFKLSNILSAGILKKKLGA